MVIGTAYNPAFEKSIVGLCLSRSRDHVSELHDVDDIVDGDIDTAHHTLIIAEEEDREAAHKIDGDEKSTLLVSMDDIEPRDLVHACAFLGSLLVEKWWYEG